MTKLIKWVGLLYHNKQIERTVSTGSGQPPTYVVVDKIFREIPISQQWQQPPINNLRHPHHLYQNKLERQRSLNFWQPKAIEMIDPGTYFQEQESK